MPSFSDNADILEITFHERSNAQVSNDELADPYTGNEKLDWIKEHNHVVSTDALAVFEGREPAETKVYHEGYKVLKGLFYDIQQTSYFCDFTLESAQFSFEKYFQEEQEKKIQKERDYQKDMWSYILKKQIAPLRWTMSMWTRYNIAEPSIHNSIATFRSDWALVA